MKNMILRWLGIAPTPFDNKIDMLESRVAKLESAQKSKPELKLQEDVLRRSMLHQPWVAPTYKHRDIDLDIPTRLVDKK